MLNIMKHHLIRRFKKVFENQGYHGTFCLRILSSQVSFLPKMIISFFPNCRDVSMLDSSFLFSQTEAEFLFISLFFASLCNISGHWYYVFLSHLCNLVLFIYLGFGHFFLFWFFFFFVTPCSLWGLSSPSRNLKCSWHWKCGVIPTGFFREFSFVHFLHMIAALWESSLHWIHFYLAFLFFYHPIHWSQAEHSGVETYLYVLADRGVWGICAAAAEISTLSGQEKSWIIHHVLLDNIYVTNSLM